MSNKKEQAAAYHEAGMEITRQGWDFKAKIIKDLLDKAIELDPNNAKYLIDNAKFVLRYDLDPSKKDIAIGHLKKALKIEPQNEIANKLLAAYANYKISNGREKGM